MLQDSKKCSAISTNLRKETFHSRFGSLIVTRCYSNKSRPKWPNTLVHSNTNYINHYIFVQKLRADDDSKK